MGINNVDLKPPISFGEQVKRLSEYGMTIDDPEKAKFAVESFGYYRLSGYSLCCRTDEHSNEYLPGTSFDQILSIYQFDQTLRSILRYYLEVAEVYYRVQISNVFSQIKCTSPPYDQHYDDVNFYARDWHADIFESLGRDMKMRYTDNPVVSHHKKNYGGRMPLWVIVEFLSFSNLSKLYNSMYESEKTAIANAVGTGHVTLENHLHCLSVLRNKCAHGGRLYGKTLSPEARFNRAFRNNNTDITVDSLFAYILVLIKRLPNDEFRTRLIDDLEQLLDDYQEYIDLKCIGFPDDYVDRMKHYM